MLKEEEEEEDQEWEKAEGAGVWRCPSGSGVDLCYRIRAHAGHVGFRGVKCHVMYRLVVFLLMNCELLDAVLRLDVPQAY